MQQRNETIQAAFSDFQRLKTIHQRFVEEIQRHAQEQSPESSLTAEIEILSASYLGLEFRAVRRSVAANHRLVANEYAFVGSIGSQEQLLLCLYLTPNGGLYLNSSLDDSTRICDFNNQYVVNNILAKLQVTALSSPFFASRG